MSEIAEPPEPPLSNSSDLATLSIPATRSVNHAPPPVETRTSLHGVPSSRAELFRAEFFPETTEKQWNSWAWQLSHRLRTADDLERILPLSADERDALGRLGRHLPSAMTPYYAALMDADDVSDPIRRSMIPVGTEWVRTAGEFDDPLGEDASSPVHGLVHRYPDRVLFLVSDHCAVYCRYCTRSRLVGSGEMSVDVSRWDGALDYLRATPAVRDVLLSGGDPLTLSDRRLEHLLSRLREIPHIEFLRIGTKVPAVLPQRITPELVAMLRRYRVWMSIHFAHPAELTPEVAHACDLLSDGGIPLGSQTVLLKGINDDVGTMKELMQGLLKIRVRPYYIYQCDPITGSSHFRTPVETGLEIIEGLRGHTTGYAVPQFVIDAPGGGGKIPLLPNYLVGREGDDVLLRNFEGEIFRYRDPVGTKELPVGAGASAMNGSHAPSRNGKGSHRALKIGLTYDLRDDYLKDGYTEEQTAEFDREDTIAALDDALRANGHDVVRIGRARSLIERLAAGERWDLVFNIAEGLSAPGREAQIPAILDVYGIPYTFSDPVVTSLTLDKGLTKRVLRDLGLPTAPFAIVETPEQARVVDLPYPLFAKPVAEGTGLGVGPRSRAHNAVELETVCRELLVQFGQPVLVESDLPGREFTVGVVGTGEAARAVGALEVTMRPGAEEGIHSYHNKEHCEELVDYILVDDEDARESCRLGLAAWRGLNCRDGGRVDLRADAEGRLQILEINPLAGLHPSHSDLPILWTQVGREYNDLIGAIVESARTRCGATR